MEDGLWVGQFGIVDGTCQEESPWTGIFPSRGHGEEEPADLYMVVEPTLQDSQEHCAQLVAAVGNLFCQSDLSITGGLLQALRNAHDQMRDWNRHSIKEQQLTAGTSCIVVRGREALLAQSSPAVVYTRLLGAVQRVVPHIPEASVSLGDQEDLLPAFHRYELSTGDRALLVTTSLDEAVGEERIDKILALPANDVLPCLYKDTQGLSQGAALFLDFGKGEA